jgi:D-alanyl-D-alanine carboxypeptidase
MEVASNRRGAPIVLAVGIVALALAAAGTIVARAHGDAGGANPLAASKAPGTIASNAGPGSGPGSGSGSAPGDGPPPAGTSPPPPALRTGIDERTILVWVPRRIPDGLAAALARLPGVSDVAQVIGGTAWMAGSASPSGTVLDRPTSGYAIPIEVAAADAAAYVPFLPPADAQLFRETTRPGEAILGSTEQVLRRQAVGGTMAFGSADLRVAGIATDALVGAHEMFVSPATAAGLGITTPKYVLVLPADGTSAAALVGAIRRRIPAGTQALVERVSAAPFPRDSPNTLPPVLEKVAMGEFAGRPVSGGAIQVDPAWVGANILTANVPILGDVTCNRAFFPQLREALSEVEREGLASLIHPAEYAGCFVPRFVSRDPAQLISHHAWGSALDLNASENRFGSEPTMDRRIVEIFTSLGFQWGGAWLVPDGMHFEFLTSPPVH